MNWAAVCLAGLALLLAGLYLFARLRYRAAHHADELIRVEAPGGCSLALHRFVPAGQPRESVFLCHGLGANGFNLDFCDREVSLACFLRDRGHEVFLIDLRGHGESRFRSPFSPARHTISFSDYVADLALAIRHADTVRHGRRLHYVGHSMGGMLGYAGIIADPGLPLASLTAVGSPVRFSPRRYRLILWLRHVVPPFWGLHLQFWATLAAPLTPLLTAVFRNLYNPANMKPAWIPLSAVNLLDTIHFRVLREMAGWVAGKRFRWPSGGPEVEESLETLRLPLHVVCSEDDRIVPAWTAKPAFDRSGSIHKRLLLFPSARDGGPGFGHGDLIVGVPAPERVFDPIERFITDVPE